jgi:formate hydrogenlyase subunit 4
MIAEIIGAIVAVIVQAAGILFLAPLITGFSRTLKARLQTRRGPHILQPYRDLYKLARKSMVISDTASWLFSATPFVLFATTLSAGLLIPFISAEAPMSLFGGALAVVYLLALGRFFLALGGLDTGSSFGGLGSSREMTISAIAEPALMLAVFTVAIGAGSTNLSLVAHAALGQSWHFLAPQQMLAFAALFVVLIAETGRIPVDNPATHLELTMIHEAMILEYSGPFLALVEWSAWMKQLVLMTLLVNIFFPYGLSAGWSPLPLLLSVLLFIVKLAALAIAVVLVETANAKLRLFRVPELLAVAFVLSALALISMFLF